jgi:hypothetical protein
MIFRVQGKLKLQGRMRLKKINLLLRKLRLLLKMISWKRSMMTTVKSLTLLSSKILKRIAPLLMTTRMIGCD